MLPRSFPNFPGDNAPLTPEIILNLQAQVGNRAVIALLHGRRPPSEMREMILVESVALEPAAITPTEVLPPESEVLQEDVVLSPRTHHKLQQFFQAVLVLLHLSRQKQP